MPSAIARLTSELTELQHLHGIMAVLSWDQEVTMPPQGARNRAAQRSTLASLIHQRLTAADLGTLLADLAADPGLDAATAAAVRLATRQRERAVRLPSRLVRDLAEAVGLAHAEWVAARDQDDWARFAPHLERIVALKREEAAALAIGDEPYDALLDEYEPDARTADLLPVFRDLRAALTDLLARLEPCPAPLPDGPYPLDGQVHLNLEVLRVMGYDLAAGRLDASAHPFTETLGHGDVRVTTRYHDDDVLSGLSSTMHEGGHALYEQGLPAHLAWSPAGQAVSLGIHESQSRLWENQVGRGLPFCRWLAPRLREHFPAVLADLDPERLHRAANRVEPSLIRIEADEVTYNLHIILRLEIERALMSGDIAVADVPAMWADQMRDLLGLEVPDQRRGPLQDIHWCMGAIGYFPTYTLGNLYAAMFWNACRGDLPDLDNQLATGDCSALLHWLRTHIHEPASLLPAGQLCRRVTGHDLRADDFVAYLGDKFGA